MVGTRQETRLGQAPRPALVDSTAWGAALAAAYALLAVAPLAFVLAVRPAGSQSVLQEAGKAAGLCGFALLALQVALSARAKAVERPFGLDVLMQVHRAMGVFAMGLLVLHPILLAWGRRSAWLFSFQTPWPIVLGKIALAGLVVGTLSALYFRRLHLDYQVWRLLHKGMILIVAAGFLHGLTAGADLRPIAPRICWWLLLVLAACFFAYRNLVLPFRRRRCQVVAVTPRTGNTFTLTLKPEAGSPPRHRPGQFMFLTLRPEGRHREEHPFTISSPPTQKDVIEATIKKSGDFTSEIERVKPGDMALIDAPYGRFSCVHHGARRFIFIAGGVGITPIYSMLRYLHDTGDTRPVLCLYGNRAEDDIVFRRELALSPKHVEVVHVLSEADDAWPGERGYITRELIERYAREFLSEADIYVCGPPPMMHKVFQALRARGVPDRRIHAERFLI